MNAWEYMSRRLDTGDLLEVDKELNALGEDGWELVSVTSLGIRHSIAYLKRPNGFATPKDDLKRIGERLGRQP